MKTSLIIPVYNEEKYLPLCLDSLVLQSFPADEIIICDNNSTDRSVAIAKSYQSKLPIKILHQPQKGIIPTIEKAWRASTNDLILKTDADCVLPKNWIKNIIDHFNADPHLSVASSFFLASDGNFLFRFTTLPSTVLIAILFSLTHGYPLIFGGNTAIRRSVMAAVDGYRGYQKKIPDDQYLSQKLHQYHFRVKFFFDFCNRTSTRRFSSLRSVLIAFMSTFQPWRYQEKSN